MGLSPRIRIRHAGVYPQLDSSIRFSSPLLRWSGVAPCRNPSTKDEGGSASPNDGYFHHERIEKTAYAEKSSLGKRACELILQKYGRRRVFAVCMWGDETENSQPYYGLNLLVVVRDVLRIPAQHYLLNGLEVSVYYWEEISILHQARTFTEEWPWSSNNYRTRIVLHEKNGW